MTITHILVHVEPGAVSEARLGYALSMAARFGAMLTGIAVTVPPTTVAFAMMGDAQLYGAAVQAATESCEAAKIQFRTLTEGSAVTARWHQGDGIPVEVIAAEAGCADLVVLGREDTRDPDAGFYALSPADVIMACGRPVLVLPDSPPAAFDGRRILLGWKNTAEATRAAHDSLPLLRAAEQVVMVEIVPRHPANSYAISTDSMAEHLRSHGVNVVLRRIPEEGDTGELLIRTAGENDCQLIVVGGYGHSRVREWVLGGVTRSLLQASAIPCLLSH